MYQILFNLDLKFVDILKKIMIFKLGYYRN
jgi:hypothetical protein